MDTARLKFIYSKPDTFFFSETIHKKELNLEHISGSRFGWTNNTWRKERMARGIYTPKYWIEEDFVDPAKTYFYFEASIPKLITEENITALKDDQLDEAVMAISSFCKELGLYVFPEQIKNAVPTLLAMGENINLTSYCSVNNALKVLKPFDYKPHSSQRLVDFSDCKHGGKEVIFSIPSETFKAYDKSQEIQNRAETSKELEIAELLKRDQFTINGQPTSEILRVELTLKTKRKIQQRFKPYLKELNPTFQNLFKVDLWKQILKDEVNKTFNHPLQKMIFLSLESQPFIDTFLDQNYKHIQTKDTVRGILASLQEFGLAETRNRYLKRYKSRQTWYNYLKRLKELEKHFDWTALAKLDNAKIHSYVLGNFGISNGIQQELDLIFDTQLSKNIDSKLRNALE